MRNVWHPCHFVSLQSSILTTLAGWRALRVVLAQTASSHYPVVCSLWIKSFDLRFGTGHNDVPGLGRQR